MKIKVYQKDISTETFMCVLVSAVILCIDIYVKHNITFFVCFFFIYKHALYYVSDQFWDILTILKYLFLLSSPMHPQ